MGDFDFNEKFPISQYIQGVIEKKKLEEQFKEQGRRSLLAGIGSIGDDILANKANKKAEAQTLAQAALLSNKRPDLADAFGASNPVASRSVPLPIGQAGPMNQVPITANETESGRNQVVSSLANAIRGISPEALLNQVKPEDEISKSLKLARLKQMNENPEAKPQLRLNQFSGEWEWYTPPSSNVAPGSVVSSGPGRTDTGPGTFRERSKAIGSAAEEKTLISGVLSELDRVDALNQNSRGGLIGGLIQKAQSATDIKTNSSKFKNTADVVNTLKGQVAKVLKSTFGGQLSDGERQYLNEVYGAAESMTPTERSIAIKNVKTMLQDKVKASQAKVKALTGQQDAEQDDNFSSLSDEELQKIAAGGK